MQETLCTCGVSIHKVASIIDDTHLVNPDALIARSQAEKFPGDLYTPAIVRAGKSSGKGEAAGGIGTKEAWCGLCEPHQTAASGNGNSLIGGWLNLRNSSYR